MYVNGKRLGKMVKSGLTGPLRWAVTIGGKAVVSVESVAPEQLGAMTEEEALDYLAQNYYDKDAQGEIMSNNYFEGWTKTMGAIFTLFSSFFTVFYCALLYFSHIFTVFH